MKSALSVILANLPALLCAGGGGLLADRGHPWFGAAFLLLAYNLLHTIQRRDQEPPAK